VSVLRSLFLVARLYRPYHPKVLTLQWPPARRTILNLLGVRLAVLEVIEEYPTVFLSDPPELPPEPVCLLGHGQYRTTIAFHLRHAEFLSACSMVVGYGVILAHLRPECPLLRPNRGYGSQSIRNF
jgi:hypothetical protein